MEKVFEAVPRNALADCEILLDEGYAAIQAGGNIADAVGRLRDGLASIRARAPIVHWKYIAAFCREHALLPILHEDPFMARVYRKPRGYPGDAGMIDYLYRVAPTEAERLLLTKTGRLLVESMVSMPSGCAVRERKRLAAQEIDAVAAEHEHPTIFSLAAGHMREAAESDALRRGGVGRFVAIDQDPKGLDTIRADYGAFGIECLQLSVLDLLRDSPPLQGAHLIYALGLFDYLQDVAARRLIAALARMLAPGGRLLIANFTPGTPEAAYMEVVGDWYLTYRTQTELESLAGDVDGPGSFRHETWTDHFGCIAYMRITRCGDA